MDILTQLTPHRLRKYLTLNNGAIAIALLIAASWTWGTVTTLQKNFVLQQQLDQLNQRNEILELQTRSLAYEQQYFRSDEYLELAARDMLGLGQPGEKLLLLPDSSGLKDEVRTQQRTAQEPSNFSQWMMFFFGNKDATS